MGLFSLVYAPFTKKLPSREIETEIKDCIQLSVIIHYRARDGGVGWARFVHQRRVCHQPDVFGEAQPEAHTLHLLVS